MWRIASESPIVRCRLVSLPSLDPTDSVQAAPRGKRSWERTRVVCCSGGGGGKSRTIPFPFSLPPESVFGCLLAWERPIGSVFLLPSSSPSLPQCCDLKGKKSGGIKKEKIGSGKRKKYISSGKTLRFSVPIDSNMIICAQQFLLPANVRDKKVEGDYIPYPLFVF